MSLAGTEYPKIHSLFKRDMDDPKHPMLYGVWAHPEFAYLQYDGWEFTEKVDGMNIRVVLDETGKFHFGGRTADASIPAKLVAHLQELFLPLREELCSAFPNGIKFYGEGYGAKIQKGGGNYRQDQGFVLFDVRVGNWWLPRADMLSLAETFGVEVVPFVGSGTLHDALRLVEEGFKSEWGDFAAEGVIAKPAVPLFTSNGSRVITKVKTRDFANMQYINRERVRNLIGGSS